MESGDKTLVIIRFCIGWMCCVPAALFPAKYFPTRSMGSWVGPQKRTGRFAEEINGFLLPAIERTFLDRPARVFVTIPTAPTLPAFLWYSSWRRHSISQWIRS